MAYFGKRKFVAAIACLKKAQYLEPFKWSISYNLGLIHLNTQQYASAFHYFSSAINLRRNFAPAYMYLGVALSNLQDTKGATNAFQKANDLDKKNPLVYLNFCIAIVQNESSFEKAKQLF